LALAGGTVAAVWALRRSVPLLDAATLEGHQRRWQERPLLDYDMALNVHNDGQEIDRHRVEVRAGALVAQTLNGAPRATGDSSYTIEGLFRILERELEMAAEPRRDGTTGHTTLRARFDQDLGVPLVFKRLTTLDDRRSTSIEVEEISVPGKGRIYPP
jgi:hypothetical protein